MTQARKSIVSIENTPYYHCIGRCVRRAFLCGQDEFSGQNYEHRRQWVVDRLMQLTDAFSIEVSGYAIMSNHYHLVLCMQPQKIKKWSNKKVIQQWQKLYSATEQAKQYAKGIPLSKTDRNLLDAQLSTWRTRLGDISWFMRCLNEYIARKANQEDKCTGRFWEGRFKSQALLDEKSLLACMAYVDLNPIRAKIAKTPEASNYTSIRERLRKMQNKPHKAAWLMSFTGNRKPSTGLPFLLQDYAQLVEWSGRMLREGKRGAISKNTPPLLARLNIASDYWLQEINAFEKNNFRCAGTKNTLVELANKIGQNWLWGCGKLLTS